jgi:hypothetical protein
MLRTQRLEKWRLGEAILVKLGHRFTLSMLLMGDLQLHGVLR